VTRRTSRYEVWLPVKVGELADGMAISHNVSGRGMLLVTARTLEVGASVQVVVSLPPDGETEKHLHGRVVRVEENTDDPHGLWPHRLAVEFDEPVADLEQALAELSSAGVARIQR
jgi:hypothetical protein